MATLNRTHVDDTRGLARLACDATGGIAGIVEQMHRTIQLARLPLGPASTDRPGGITGLVYRAVRGGIALVGKGLDAGLVPVGRFLPEGESSVRRDRFVSALNGVYGDYLLSTGNPLAIGMSLHPGAASTTASRMLVLVHGLCLDHHAWSRSGHDHGAALAGELGYVPVYVRYNSGLAVADNGRELACRLERLCANRPRPVEELVLVGHSMGGLVARSACLHGEAAGHGWRTSLRSLVFLGTPHHGAPLERGGHRLDALMHLSPYASPFTRLGKTRSAGIQDLRSGRVTTGEDGFAPLPADVRCFALAATLARRGSVLRDRLVGDGLVPLDSALGRHADPGRCLEIPGHRRWVARGTRHMDLLSRPEIYARLRKWLAAD